MREFSSIIVDWTHLYSRLASTTGDNGYGYPVGVAVHFEEYGGQNGGQKGTGSVPV